MGLIAEETIDKVAAANDIVDVIGSYFKLTRAGSNYKALCPFHQEKTPSFIVNPQRQSFHCFGCGAGGGVFRFVMDYESIDFPSAVRRLADRAGIPVIEEQASADEERKFSRRKRLLALHQETAEWFAHNLLKSKNADPARAYLKSREINITIAKTWKLGWAPDSWDEFSKWAHNQGYSENELIESGLLSVREDDRSGSRSTYDRFRGRIMFPVCNDLGEVIAFSGRILDAEAKAAKYINSPESLLFTKGKVLFGLNHSKRALLDSKSAIVCEGQIDVIRLFESGFQNVVAPQGTAFTSAQAQTLRRFVDKVILCFDADDAGQAAAEKSYIALTEADLDVLVATLPPGEDPDSIIRTNGSGAFRERLDAAQDYFTYLLERSALENSTQSPRGKAHLASRMAQAIAIIPNPILRDSTITSSASRIGIGIPELRRLVEAASSSRSPVASDNTQQQEAPPQQQATLPRPSQAMCQLILLAIQHLQAREWLQAQEWPDVLDEIPGIDTLQAIVKTNGNDAIPLSSLLPRLTPEQESLVSSIINSSLPDSLDTLTDCWRWVIKFAHRQQIDRYKARLSDSSLSREEISQLQKEILDAQRRAIDNAQLFTAAQP